MLEDIHAQEAPLLEVAPHRELLFQLLEGALRAEHGVRYRRAAKGNTDYYAGRRAGFIAASARLMAVLYGGDYDAAKHAVGQGVKLAGEGVTLPDLVEPHSARALAVTIAESALRVI